MRERLLSLDIFRGLTVALMILVNNQYIGDAYPQLRHVSWDGLTLTDLVFPFFIFIVGASFRMVYQRSTDDKALVKKLIIRGAKIFGVGLFLNLYSSGFEFEGLRIMGVLQRIALAYVLGGLIVIALKKQWLIAVTAYSLLVLYACMTLGLGDLTAEGSFARMVDLAIIGEANMYNIGIAFDPEGLFGTISATASMLLGYIAAILMTTPSQGVWHRLSTTAICGIGSATVIGLNLHSIIPINKMLWSSSFVLVTAGLAMVCWAVLYIFSDILKWKKIFQPAMVFGTNTIFAYALHILIAPALYKVNVYNDMSIAQTFDWALDGVLPQEMITLLWGVLFVVIVYLMVYPLYRKKIYIKL